MVLNYPLWYLSGFHSSHGTIRKKSPKKQIQIYRIHPQKQRSNSFFHNLYVILALFHWDMEAQVFFWLAHQPHRTRVSTDRQAFVTRPRRSVGSTEEHRRPKPEALMNNNTTGQVGSAENKNNKSTKNQEAAQGKKSNPTSSEVKQEEEQYISSDGWGTTVAYTRRDVVVEPPRRCVDIQHRSPWKNIMDSRVAMRSKTDHGSSWMASKSPK